MAFTNPKYEMSLQPEPEELQVLRVADRCGVMAIEGGAHPMGHGDYYRWWCEELKDKPEITNMLSTLFAMLDTKQSEIPDGRLMRTVRERMGVSLDKMSEHLKVVPVRELRASELMPEVCDHDVHKYLRLVLELSPEVALGLTNLREKQG